MNDPALPPGVSQRDLDIHDGVLVKCAICGRLFDCEPDCSDLCPRCEQRADDFEDR